MSYISILTYFQLKSTLPPEQISIRHSSTVDIYVWNKHNDISHFVTLLIQVSIYYNNGSQTYIRKLKHISTEKSYQRRFLLEFHV